MHASGEEITMQLLPTVEQVRVLRSYLEYSSDSGLELMQILQWGEVEKF